MPRALSSFQQTVLDAVPRSWGATTAEVEMGVPTPAGLHARRPGRQKVKQVLDALIPRGLVCARKDERGLLRWSRID